MLRVEQPRGFLWRFAQTICLLFVAFLATSAWADFDSGDIAVIEADPTILQPGEDFDLSGKTLTFTPKAGGGYTIGIAVGAINPNLGTNLALGDDASTGALPLGFSFPFFGTSYTSVFTNSNGYVTFGAASSFVSFNSGPDLNTVLDRMAGGVPRIGALWNDLNPSAGGGVFFNVLADRVLITWNAVPRFGAPGTSNTFQIALFPSGIIQLTYGSISPASTDPVLGGFLVGISPGSSSQFFTTTLDLHTGSGGSVSAVPILEPLMQVFGSMPNPLVHIPAVARRFYLSHADSFDQLVMFADFTNALGDALAFEFPIRISMAGTGQSMVNATSFFGSAGRLHSMLNMNRLSVYPNDLNCLADPNCRLPGNNDSTLTLMGQESGHQWLAFLRFDDGGVSSDLLLGRDLAHWSFFLDSDASNMEGNNWIDNGNGTFTSNELTIRYSPLDQYAMGLRIAAEVLNFFFIRSPSPPNPCGTSAPEGGRACSPAIGVTVSGTRQNVSIGQVTSIVGFRPPGFTGVNPTTTWHQAFILVVGAGTTPASADMNKINTIRSAWVPYFNTATDGRGSVDTVLGISPTLVAAVLPTERTGLLGGPIVTAFATILNAGPVTALGCAISPLTTVPATFLYQTTNPNDNTLTGTANTPADIPPGQGQTFVFAFTPTAPFPLTEIQLRFICVNSVPAPIVSAVNTFRLRATATPAPDPVALVAVGPPNDGILRLASVGAFAVATVNVGAPGLLTVTADTGGVALPVSITLCETDPQSGQCLALPPTPTVQRQMNSGATASFGVFVTGTGPIAFDPANHRIQFHLEGGGGGGGTSVAVCSAPLCP
jgi:hypothetical protein